MGAAFVQAFVRVREQVYSNLVGLHVTAGSSATGQRLQDYAHALAARSIGQAEAGARAVSRRAHSMQIQADV